MNPSTPREPLTTQRGWRATLLLILVATLAKLAYLLWLCPYNLVEDEAHYWEWSRRLDWSYYTKGPGIALTIWLSTQGFRVLGLELSEAAVRFCAPIASAVLMLALAWLTRLITRSSRAAFLAAALVLLAPGLHMTSLLITIDGPYAASWACAALFAYLALRKGSAIAWPLMGLAIGVGFAYKYTILLLPPGIIAWALWQRRELVLHPRWRPLLIAALAAASLGLVPVLIWNAQNEWGTVRHLLGHLGMAAGDQPVSTTKAEHYTPAWTLALLGAQLGLMGPALFLLLHRTRHAPARETPPVAIAAVDRNFLLACAVPVFAFYLVVSFIAEPEGNWPLAGHLTLIPLIAIAVVKTLHELELRRRDWWATHRPGIPRRHGLAALLSRQPQTVSNVVWLLALVVGLGAILLTIRLDRFAQGYFMTHVQTIAERAGIMKPGNKIIPLGRFMGAEGLAADADRKLKRLASITDDTPFILCHHYGRASQMAFYMPGNPVVHCASHPTGGRITQYDKWPDTALDNPALNQTLLGKPALILGGWAELWAPAFERLEPLGPLEGEPKPAERPSFFGYGYKGSKSFGRSD